MADQPTQTITGDVRVTVGISKKGKNIWIAASKKLQITQWEMADIMFRLADPENPKIVEMAKQISEKNKLIREQRKEITRKLNSLTPEQLERLLAS